ncbi:hypothetical protein DFH08DRAFT_846076 [Mycena albidolilacea]|uniref:Uncharacterized protein n=1 Tax=Mycena albidolilacea TaxID=1033008 RepID=A0AAD7EYK7_9AGAR|nr:hypothetical protein DFH08DRAFT_846076 [Mycena albidolilacea]
MSGRTLSLVLPLLDLKRISLIDNAPVEWDGNGEFRMDWNSLGRVLNSALAAVFFSPTLESVHLRGIVVDSPAQLFSLFSEATSTPVTTSKLNVVNLRSVHFFTFAMEAQLLATFAACTQNSCPEEVVFEGPAGRGRYLFVDASINLSMPHLGALRMVELRVYSYNNSDPPFHEWLVAVQALLPSLVKRGLLTLTEVPRADRDPHLGWE